MLIHPIGFAIHIKIVSPIGEQLH